MVFQQASKYYRELNGVRLDPLGKAQLDLSIEPKNPALVFFGDSRAKQWPDPSWFVESSINLGVSGQTTAQILGRYDEHLAPLNPRLVVFQAGINDLKTIPLFPDSEEEIIENCKRNISKIVELCNAQNIHVILTTIFPVGGLPLKRRFFWSDRVDPAIEELNIYIRSLASDDVTILDSAELLVGDDGHISPQYSLDFLHLNTLGNSQLDSALMALVKGSPKLVGDSEPTD